MMGIFAGRARTGNKIILSFMNGTVLEGIITGLGEDFVLVETDRGIAGVRYAMVGAWELLSDSKPENESDILKNGPVPGGPEGESPDNINPESGPEAKGIRDFEEPETPGPEEGIEAFVPLAGRMEELLGTFKKNVTGAKLALKEPDFSFPLNSLDSDHLQEDKKEWDKINSKYRDFIKNKNLSSIPLLVAELLRFARKYPEIGAFHYNAGCYQVKLEAFRQALEYFEEAARREPRPEYFYNAAASALKIRNFEKARLSLTRYFELVNLLEAREAWYVFCGLTENGEKAGGKNIVLSSHSVFRDVLLYCLRNYSGQGDAVDQDTGANERENLEFLLKSALYVLEMGGKYREAEPLVDFLDKEERGEREVEWKEAEKEKAAFLIEEAFAVFPAYTGVECERNVEVLNLHKKGFQAESLKEKAAQEDFKGIARITVPEILSETIGSETIGSETIGSESIGSETIGSESIVSEDGRGEFGGAESRNPLAECSEKNNPKSNSRENEPSKVLCSKIPRRVGDIYNYIPLQGYGFITDREGKNHFFHVSSIIDSSISEGKLNNIVWGAQMRVVFESAKGSRGNIATQISSYEVLDEMQKLAKRYAKAGDYKKAVEQVGYLLSIDPEHPGSRELFEEWGIKQKEVLEEEEGLNELLKNEPGNRANWDSKVDFLIKHRVYEEALLVVDKVIELTPESLNSLPLKKQLNSFGALYASNPEYIKTLCKKSFVLTRLGRHKEALETADQALKIDPEHADSLAMRASSLLKLERPQEALELLEKVLEKESKRGDFLFLKGNALLKFHEYERGLEELEKARNFYPKDSEILLKIGYALSKLNRFAEAVKAYDKAIELRPESPKALANKGFILIMSGKYEEALEFYNSLICLNPFNPMLWSKKGAILTKMHRSDEALKAVDQALEIAPYDSETLFTKGYIYSKNGRHEEALKYFDRVLELKPYDQKALTKKAFVFSRLGRPDEALEAIKEALVLSRYNPRTWYYKGFIHYNIEEYEEALSAFNKSEELNPADPRIERMKRFTLARLGRQEEGSLADNLQAEEELFDKELQDEYDSEEYDFPMWGS
ncbi:MAG: tetratricopeptide repeat protein [Methanosarcinaceae archaeon]|nr:tetratricopeptide repeat protein [Methanosarcinaceae archaeon]